MVSHGAMIRTWVAARAANVDVAYASSHPLGNTGIVVLSGSPDRGWQVLLWEEHPLGPEGTFPADSGPAGAAAPTRGRVTWSGSLRQQHRACVRQFQQSLHRRSHRLRYQEAHPCVPALTAGRQQGVQPGAVAEHGRGVEPGTEHAVGRSRT
jgi:hypothetical protein